MKKGIEVKLISNSKDLDDLIPQLKQFIQIGKTINISWSVTELDIFEHKYKQNQHLENDQQLANLQKLLTNCDAYPDLKKRITLTLSLYQLEKKQNYQASIDLLLSLKETMHYQARAQQLKVLKKLKEKTKEINNIELIKQIVETCQQQNQICKEDIRRIYEDKQNLLEQDVDIKMWFLQQIQHYEKNNWELLVPLFYYYYGKNDLEQMDKIFLQIYPNDKELDLEIKKQKFDYFAEEFKEKKQKLESFTARLTESTLSDNMTKEESVLKLYELKKEMGFPILKQIPHILEYIVIQKNNQKIKDAVALLEETLKKVKLELLVNFNLKILSFESYLLDQLGECQKKLEKLDEAVISFQVSIKIKDEAKEFFDTKNYIQIKMFLASVYYKQNKFDEALEAFEQVLKLQKNNDFESHMIGSTENNIASILLAKGEKKKALEYCQNALDKLKQKYSENDPVYKKVKSLQEKIEAAP